MNAVQFEKNYFYFYKNVSLYVDYANNRLKIFEHQAVSEDVIREIIEFARDQGLGKIIGNCRIRLLKPYKNAGFAVEGLINGFYRGEDAYCISCFLDSQRSISPRKKEEDLILLQSVKEADDFVPCLDTAFKMRDAAVEDIPQLVALFSSVFETYPSPVFSMEYLQKVMNDKVLFKVITCNDKIVSVASADMDSFNLNAEITDCATYPDYRGKGLLSNLIHQLEYDLREKGFYTLYSLSRAINPGINRALGKLNYKFSGRLANNCHMCGGFEDMNIWVKRIIQ